MSQPLRGYSLFRRIQQLNPWEFPIPLRRKWAQNIEIFDRMIKPVSGSDGIVNIEYSIAADGGV